jgi:hypothetical protein
VRYRQDFAKDLQVRHGIENAWLYINAVYCLKVFDEFSQ